MNYNFDPDRDYSKKEIAEITELSANTVTDSLKTAGLSTSKRFYTGSELLERFVPVRKMLDAGRTHEEICAARRMRQASSSTQENWPGGGGFQPPDSSSALETDEAVIAGMGSFEDAINAGIRESIESAVQDATRDIVQFIPAMVAKALAEAAQSGQIRDVFHSRLREYFAQRRSAEFLLQANKDKEHLDSKNGDEDDGDSVKDGDGDTTVDISAEE
ncbi:MULTISPECIES: hypothetical protein [Cyanophyceae]|uniref:Uncharacterized protein n=1 Tax=Leptolyngbya subtilissima DQ-A4 TaxID=2933933 RepID=A0ABV0KA87_9CYAN|nr:hypothetical protein [Nodosilinea sp. FACHB-141]MBD2115179.1 hypothetical protein [Nodosilinea sp. FACHB-141]